MDWLQITIAITGGLFAGIINTLAGNGSAMLPDHPHGSIRSRAM